MLSNKAKCPRKWHRHFNRITYLPFFFQDQSAKKSAYLNTTAVFHTGELSDLNCDVLQLPYAGQHQLMYIFLPKSLDGLAQLEKDLFNADTCTAWYGRLEKLPIKLVNVSIPVFHIETMTSLNKVLVKMGLQRLFDAQYAAFSPWTKDSDFCIGNYTQDVKVDFEFRGKYNPPSAKNIRRMSTRSQLGKVVYFTADHPFIFVVHDRITDTVQFIGRVCHPVNRLIPSSNASMQIICKLCNTPLDV